MGNTKRNTKHIAWAVIATAVLAIGGWRYYQSPDLVAARQLKQAAEAKAAGLLSKAAQLYADVASSHSNRVADGTAGLRSLLDAALLRPLPAGDASEVLLQARRAREAGQVAAPSQRLVALGWELIDVHSKKDPRGAKFILDAVAPLESDKGKVAAAAEPLLERIVGAEPGDSAAAIQFAELLDRRRACARCEALLAPHTAKLAGSEGARILGQIYAGKGQLDESYALLQPYSQDKLKVFQQRELEYRETVDSLEKEAFEKLKQGGAPPDFYKKYDASDEATRREMVGNYIGEQLSGNQKLKSLLQALRESATIVPVALDLGVVTVQRAQKLSDPAARNAQFEAAEKVFLSIRGAAGNTDSYRLYLGQVYYWLGKQTEGKKLFDELLESHHRNYGVLMEVGSLMRSVGAVHDARMLIEEAHGKAKDNAERESAAHVRSVMNTDVEDELLWLERSDRSVGRVRASIHTTRAMIAERKGQRAVARREYESALAELEKLPESTTQLNSLGLVQLALYAMEGDAKQRDIGLLKLDQALALSPADSILLLNNISAVESAAAAALLADRVELPLLRSPGNFEMLEFLHDDEGSREQIRRRVRENEAVKKALAYSEKASLLAPRNPNAYVFGLTVASLLEDVTSLQAITEKARAAQLDLADMQAHKRKIAEGTELKPLIEQMTAYSQRATVVLQQPALQRLPASWAVAARSWQNAQIALMRWGRPVDTDALVKTARKAHAGQPSAGTRWMLMEALEARAAQRLSKTNVSFASDLSKHGRMIDLSMLVSLHIDEDAEFRRLALADADIVEVQSLLRERARRYPSKLSTWGWLMFRHTDAAYAQSFAARLSSDPLHAAILRVNETFGPNDAQTVIGQYHLSLASGDKSKAQRVLDDARKAGVALPDLVGRQLKV